MKKRLSDWLSGLFTKVAPGGVVVGPQMWSRTIVYMTSDPIVDAARRALNELGEAEKLAESFQFDAVMERVKKAITELDAGLPGAKTVESGVS